MAGGVPQPGSQRAPIPGFMPFYSPEYELNLVVACFLHVTPSLGYKGPSCLVRLLCTLTCLLPWKTATILCATPQKGSRGQELRKALANGQ